MAKTFQQLQAEIAALTAKAQAVRKKEIREVVGSIKQAISFYGLTAEDLGFSSAAARASKKPRKSRVSAASERAGSAGAKVPVKYRDNAGNTWAGRGNQPRWLKDAIAGGARLESFRV